MNFCMIVQECDFCRISCAINSRLSFTVLFVLGENLCRIECARELRRNAKDVFARNILNREHPA